MHTHSVLSLSLSLSYTCIHSLSYTATHTMTHTHTHTHLVSLRVNSQLKLQVQILRSEGTVGIMFLHKQTTPPSSQQTDMHRTGQTCLSDLTGSLSGAQRVTWWCLLGFLPAHTHMKPIVKLAWGELTSSHSSYLEAVCTSSCTAPSSFSLAATR